MMVVQNLDQAQRLAQIIADETGETTYVLPYGAKWEIASMFPNGRPRLHYTHVPASS